MGGTKTFTPKMTFSFQQILLTIALKTLMETFTLLFTLTAPKYQDITSVLWLHDLLLFSSLTAC